MLKEKIGRLIETFKGYMVQSMTYVISYASMWAMRFSMQTVMKLLVLIFIPKLSFLAYSI